MLTAALPIPEFEPALAGALKLFGLPRIFILLLLTVLAIDSWLSNARRAAKSVKVVGNLVGRGGIWLFKQHPARLVITVAATAIVLIVQALLLKLSYTGGSLVAMPFDPVRRAAFDAAYDASPALFIDSSFLAQFLKLDAISAIYMTTSALIIAYSYRSRSNPMKIAMILSFPYSLFLFGTLSLAVITVAINGFLVLLGLLYQAPPDWTMTNTWVLSNSILTIDLISGIYCLTAFAAAYGARVVNRLWTVGDDLHGVPK